MKKNRIIGLLGVALLLIAVVSLVMAMRSARTLKSLEAQSQNAPLTTQRSDLELERVRHELDELKARYETDIEQYQARIEEMRSALEKESVIEVSPEIAQARIPTSASTNRLAPTEPPPHPEGGGDQWLSQFDRQMDRAFSQIERREKTVADEGSREILNNMKAKLEELDAAWSKYDFAESADERRDAQRDIQGAMASIIGLSRRDRNHALSELARGAGYTSEADIQQFVRAVEQTYRDTHLDWAQLFNRGPVVPSSAPGPDGLQRVSPGLVSPGSN